MLQGHLSPLTSHHTSVSTGSQSMIAASSQGQPAPLSAGGSSGGGGGG